VSATGCAKPQGPRSPRGVPAQRGRHPAARPSIDPERLRRALTLRVEHLDDGTHVVTGGAERHEVHGAACDCADAFFRRSGACKHLLAVHLYRKLDARVLEALRELVHPQAAEATCPVP
jgi:hypothetical protein